MKLSKAFMVALLAGAVAVVGCSDDPPPPDGTGGTGGTAGTGGAEPCTEGLCVAGSEPERLCKAAIEFCNSEDCCNLPGAGGAGGDGGRIDPTPAQCDDFGNLFCELDFGGTGGGGGAGGAGGEGGAGAPSAEQVCAYCDTVNQIAIDECLDAYNGCEGSLEDCVILALTACRTGVVQVFVTDTIFDGDLKEEGAAENGIAGADAICTRVAEEATPRLPGTWTAWLTGRPSEGVDSVIARDRIRDGEYRLLDGTVIANDKADLTDGMLNAAINVNENGDPETGGNVWTGTNAEGSGFEAGRCQEWATADPGQSGRPGRIGEVDAGWTDIGGGNTCDKSLHLYCFADATSD